MHPSHVQALLFNCEHEAPVVLGWCLLGWLHTGTLGSGSRHAWQHADAPRFSLATDLPRPAQPGRLSMTPMMIGTRTEYLEQHCTKLSTPKTYTCRSEMSISPSTDSQGMSAGQLFIKGSPSTASVSLLSQLPQR